MRTHYALGCTFAAICLVLASSVCAQEQRAGSIRGTVVDEEGVPVPEAKVNAEIADGRARHTAVRYVETDSNGHFVVDNLPWGTYKVVAMKEDAGYPNTAFAFYGNDVLQTSTLTPTRPVGELTIHLGPKAGVLKGAVVSTLDGAPLNASFRLTRAASPDKWLSTSVESNYRVLLPASTDILLEVSAPGFKTWTPAGPLQLHPGEELRLDISMDPSHDPNLHPSKFLVPDGYIGWLLLEYNAKDAPQSPVENGIQLFRFSKSGTISTSSCGPLRGAENEFFYYSADGSLRPISTDYRNDKGMIWGQHEGARNGVLTQFGFFVGTEQQYKKYQMLETRPGPIPTP